MDSQEWKLRLLEDCVCLGRGAQSCPDRRQHRRCHRVPGNKKAGLIIESASRKKRDEIIFSWKKLVNITYSRKKLVNIPIKDFGYEGDKEFISRKVLHQNANHSLGSSKLKKMSIISSMYGLSRGAHSNFVCGM